MAGGTMKTFYCMTILWSVLFIAAAAPALAQEDYAFIMTASGPQVCIGRVRPPTAAGAASVCEGQLIGIPQLSAISARQSVDRLDQLIDIIASIDQKMDVSNDRLGQLIEETVKAKAPADRQGKEVNEFLRETITQRFDALPKGLLANGFVMKELTRLKEDILQDVEKHYAVEQATPTE
jgi:hypothetical protein